MKGDQSKIQILVRIDVRVHPKANWLSYCVTCLYAEISQTNTSGVQDDRFFFLCSIVRDNVRGGLELVILGGKPRPFSHIPENLKNTSL